MSRQDWSIREFKPQPEKPNSCLWCGGTLKETYPGKFGVAGDGFFCTLVDAYSWAVTYARALRMRKGSS